ncbi:MAG: YetF domain-containing protein [Anaerolineaceae bacterium]|jgi:uncharacterized membrane protein YcaP (DUF421 family)
MNSKIWTDMFVLAIPWLEKILRPIIVYLALVVGLRLAGKRELAQLNPFDLVVLLTLSNTVQNAIIGDDNTVTGGIIGAATLLALNYVVVRFISKNKEVEVLVEGKEDVLIKGGVVQNDILEREVITQAELEIAAHRQGFGSLEEIETATLEPEGGISFIRKEPAPAEQRYQEIITHLEKLTGEVTALSAGLVGNKPG